MPVWIIWSLGYFILINLGAAFVTYLDKCKAMQRKWRISERTLFLFALLGGSFGMFVTMKTIRHKTHHKRFMIGLPVIFFIEAIFVGWLITFIIS